MSEGELSARCEAVQVGVFRTGGRWSRPIRWQVHCSLPHGHEGEHVAIPNHGQGPGVDDYPWVRWSDE